jgi:hypothetical protein
VPQNEKGHVFSQWPFSFGAFLSGFPKKHPRRLAFLPDTRYTVRLFAPHNVGRTYFSGKNLPETIGLRVRLGSSKSRSTSK